MLWGLVRETSIPIASSPYSFEWEDEVSANWVQDDDVEEDDNKDTTGRLIDVQGVFNELFRTPKGSNDPVGL